MARGASKDAVGSESLKAVPKMAMLGPVRMKFKLQRSQDGRETRRVDPQRKDAAQCMQTQPR